MCFQTKKQEFKTTLVIENLLAENNVLNIDLDDK